MAPPTYDATISRGIAWEQAITFQQANGDPVDLTGYGFRAQVRCAPGAAEALATMAMGDGISITDAAAGEILLELDASLTASFEVGILAWDLLVTPTVGAPYYAVRGMVNVEQGVTTE